MRLILLVMLIFGAAGLTLLNGCKAETVKTSNNSENGVFINASIIGSAESPDPVLERVLELEKKGLVSDVNVIGPVSELCRSFNRVLCAKGERLWERNTRQNLGRKRFGLR